MLTSPPKRGGWTAIFVAAVLVFGTGYGAAYLWLMEPVQVAWTGHHNPTYPHRILRPLFRPAHWIDRKIRPEFC
jgi:hypothetical protein